MQASPTVQAVQTLDITPPDFVLSTPAVVLVKKFNATAVFALTKVGTVYYQLLPASSGVPLTSAALRAAASAATAGGPLLTLSDGTLVGRSVIPSAQTNSSTLMAGLLPGTCYRLYATATDFAVPSEYSGTHCLPFDTRKRLQLLMPLSSPHSCKSSPGPGGRTRGVLHR